VFRENDDVTEVDVLDVVRGAVEHNRVGRPDLRFDSLGTLGYEDEDCAVVLFGTRDSMGGVVVPRERERTLPHSAREGESQQVD
jgi:hypothetical protein